MFFLPMVKTNNVHLLAIFTGKRYQYMDKLVSDDVTANTLIVRLYA